MRTTGWHSLSSDDAHAYTLRLSPDATAIVAVTSKMIDVEVEVAGPDGTILCHEDYWSERSATEEAFFIAPAAGPYTIRIASWPATHVTGTYRIAVQVRPATADDRRHLAVLEALGTRDAQRIAGLVPTLSDLADPTLQARVLLALPVNPDMVPRIQRLITMVGTPGIAARLIERLAHLAALSGHMSEAISLHEEAACRFRAANMVVGAAYNDAFVAERLRKTGHYDEAMARFTNALIALRNEHHLGGEHSVLVGMATCLMDENEWSAAYEYLDASRAVATLVGDVGLLGHSLYLIGEWYAERDQPQLAAQYLQDAVRLMAVDKFPAQHLGARNSLAILFENAGRLQEALNEYHDLIEKAMSVDKQAAATFLFNAGQLHFRIHDDNGGMRLLQQSRDLNRAIGDRNGQARVARGIASALLTQKEYRGAIAELHDALSLSETLHDQVGVAVTQLMLASANRELSAVAEANTLLREASTVLATTGPPSVYATALGDEAGATPDTQAATELFNRALQIADRSGSYDMQGDLEFRFGARLLEERRYDEAAVHLRKAYDFVDTMRSSLANPTTLATFAERRRAVYQTYVRVLYELARTSANQAQIAEAFLVADRYRARALQRYHGLTGATGDLRDALASIVQRSLTHTEQSTDEEQLQAVVAEYHERVAREYRSAPVDSSPTTVTAVQALIEADTTVVQYLFAEPRSYAWAITKSGVAFVAIPGGHEIDALVERARALATERIESDGTAKDRQKRIGQADREYATALKRLSDAVLAPIAAHLQRHLIIILDGSLQSFPFAALENNGAPLVDQADITVVPAAGMIGRRPKGDQRQRIAIITNPSTPTSGAAIASALPEAQREANVIAQLFGDHALTITGPGASRAAFLGLPFHELGWLHVAAHARPSTPPETSFIVLSLTGEGGRPQPGIITALDLRELPLAGTNVVLSACETAEGQRQPTEGNLGLAYAALSAGAQTVLATLWSVDDNATATLMSAYYRELRRGVAPAIALQSAQRAVKRQLPAPFFWAGFVLYQR